MGRALVRSGWRIDLGLLMCPMWQLVLGPCEPGVRGMQASDTRIPRRGCKRSSGSCKGCSHREQPLAESAGSRLRWVYNDMHWFTGRTPSGALLSAGRLAAACIGPTARAVDGGACFVQESGFKSATKFLGGTSGPTSLDAPHQPVERYQGPTCPTPTYPVVVLRVPCGVVLPLPFGSRFYIAVTTIATSSLRQTRIGPLCA